MPDINSSHYAGTWLKVLTITMVYKFFGKKDKDVGSLGVWSFLLISLCIIIIGYGYISYLSKKEVFLDKQIYELIEERFENEKYISYYQKGIQASKKYSEKWQTKSAIGLGVVGDEMRKELNNQIPDFDGFIALTLLNGQKDVIYQFIPSPDVRLKESLKTKRLVGHVDDLKIFAGFANNSTFLIHLVSDVSHLNETGDLIVSMMSDEDIFLPLDRYLYILIVWVLCALAIFLISIFLISNLHKPNEQTETSGEKNLTENVNELPLRIGSYELVEKIGAGGMAQVYRANKLNDDKSIQFQVAAKRVLPHLYEMTEFNKMFKDEARLSAKLRHPCIVKIDDFQGKDNLMVMEFINGKSLAEIMAKVNRGLQIDMATYIIYRVSMGLDYAHKEEIVHRDISPQNILISYEGEVKLSDFGIAKALSEPAISQFGGIKGKYSYLSPEEALGHPCTAQSDIYSLGIIFYEILSGERMYNFVNEIEAIHKIPNHPVPDISENRSDIHFELNSIVMKCLAKDPRNRYLKANDLLLDLSEFRRNLSITFDMSNLGLFMKKTFQKNT